MEGVNIPKLIITVGMQYDKRCVLNEKKMYRTIFEPIGTSIHIYPSVKFESARNIRIGNLARIDSGNRSSRN